jgi:uncharacterized protein with HEPN domain
MVTPDPRVYLLHIRDCCERVIECAALRDRGTTPAHILLDAACRNLEILGEASRKIGPDFRAAHPQIPWREMSDLRNVSDKHEPTADYWGGRLRIKSSTILMSAFRRSSNSLRLSANSLRLAAICFWLSAICFWPSA